MFLVLCRLEAKIASDGAFGLLDSAFVDADATMPVYKNLGRNSPT